MDFVFVGAGLALWALLALTVWGLQQLEKPAGSRP
jgi:hypothetical protein